MAFLYTIVRYETRVVNINKVMPILWSNGKTRIHFDLWGNNKENIMSIRVAFWNSIFMLAYRYAFHVLPMLHEP